MPVDPREFTREQDESRFVVTFWVRVASDGWSSEPLLVEGKGLSIVEVIDWATIRRKEKMFDEFVVHVEARLNGEMPLLIRLFGIDPTDGAR
jgi:hypothetical protein